MARPVLFDKGFGVVATVFLIGLSMATAASAQVSGPNNVFTVPACRVLDTRVSAVKGPLAANGTRNVLVRGDLTAGGAVNQGGAANCLVPANATGVFINIAAVAASGPGYLKVYPYNKPLPVSSTVNFSTGQTIAAATLAPLCTGSCGLDLSVTMGPAAAHLVIDVTGYITP